MISRQLTDDVDVAIGEDRSVDVGRVTLYHLQVTAAIFTLHAYICQHQLIAFVRNMHSRRRQIVFCRQDKHIKQPSTADSTLRIMLD